MWGFTRRWRTSERLVGVEPVERSNGRHDANQPGEYPRLPRLFNPRLGDKAYKNAEMIAERPIRTLTQALYGGREKKLQQQNFVCVLSFQRPPGSKSDCSGGVVLAPEPTTV